MGSLFTKPAVKTVDSDPILREDWRQGVVWEDNVVSRRTDIQNYKPFSGCGVDNANILIIGATGGGKSSFINALDTAISGELSSKVPTGSAKTSLTKVLTKHEIYKSDGTKMNLRLWDTCGMEIGQTLVYEDIKLMLGGYIKSGYEFKSSGCIEPTDPHYFQQPTVKHQVHTIVFVFDGSTLKVIDIDMRRKFDRVKELGVRKGIPVAILLTKVDLISPAVQKDLTMLFKSQLIQDQIQRLSNIIGVTPMQILPVRNYYGEGKIDDKVDLLTMYTLKRLLRMVDSCMQNHLNVGED